MQTLELSFIRRVLLTFLVLLPSTHALAVGLGDARVSSYLNQPLRAQIQIITKSGEELGTVTANLASAEDFEMMGLKRLVSVPLHFEVDTETGNEFVSVSSRLPITDPVIQLVLEVRWSGGRMLREYTLFLDPPTFASKAPLPMVSTRPAVA